MWVSDLVTWCFWGCECYIVVVLGGWVLAAGWVGFGGLC